MFRDVTYHEYNQGDGKIPINVYAMTCSVYYEYDVWSSMEHVCSNKILERNTYSNSIKNPLILHV